MPTTDTTKTKKRKRGYGPIAGLDLPEIPGIPPEVVAVQLECFRTIKTFLRDHFDTKPLRLSRLPASTAACDVIAQASSEGTTQSEVERQKQCVQQKCARWLHAVHSFVVREKGASPNLIQAILHHLIGQTPSHKRLTRRATHYMGGQLLWKSADARRWWLEQDRLLEWTDWVTSSPDGAWKYECWSLLHDVAQSFGDKYQSVAIAAQRLEQLCPNLITGTAASAAKTIFLPELRRLRDEAIAHSEKLESMVRKKLDKAYGCIDILAPGVTHEASAAPEANMDTNSKGSEDDDSIDWEDGCDEGSNTDDHEANVERTLQTMAATGGLHEGGLEIDFSATVDDSNERQDNVKNRLSKLVFGLEKKYLPRLTSWVDALLQADSLVAASLTSTTFVRFSDMQIQQRRASLDRCLRLKQQISNLITSSRRLGVEEQQQQTHSTQARVTSQTRTSSEVHRGLQSTIHWRLRNTGKSRPRIQIKYNK